MGSYAGVDWASEKYDVLVEDAGGERLLGATFAHHEPRLRSLCRLATEALRAVINHCMAWTIDDLLEDSAAREWLAERTYLLEDCTSAVVVPGVVDYTDEADAAFARYAAAGMHIVRSTDPMETWPRLRERRA